MKKSGATRKPRSGPAVKAARTSTHPLLDAALIQNPHKPPVSATWNKEAAAAMAKEFGSEFARLYAKLPPSEKKAVQSVFGLIRLYKDFSGWKNAVTTAVALLTPGAAENGQE